MKNTVSYNLDGLMDAMKPFKITTKDLKVEDIFINISRGYPKTYITVECVKFVNESKDVITFSDKTFININKGLYRYNERTIKILQNWNTGYNLIEEIQKDLIELNVLALHEVKEHVKFKLIGDTKHG